MDDISQAEYDIIVVAVKSLETGKKDQVKSHANGNKKKNGYCVKYRSMYNGRRYAYCKI